MFDNFLNQTLWIGSVIRTQYRLGPVVYDHYGIYEGLGDVIHFSDGMIRRTTLENFSKESIKENIIEAIGFKAKITKVNMPYESRHRARNLLGHSGYSLKFNNCEHFALYCRIEYPYSTQADTESNILKGTSEEEIDYYSLLLTTTGLSKREVEVDFAAMGLSTRKVENEEKIGMVVIKEIDTSSIIDDLGEPGEEYYASYFTAETRNPIYFENSLKSIFLKYEVNTEGDLTFNERDTDDEGITTIEIDDFSFSVSELKTFMLELEDFLEDETEYYSCSLSGAIRC